MSDLDQLMYWRGVSAEYTNYRGERVEVPLENRVNLLKAMGVNVSSDEAIKSEAYRLDVEPWKHWFPKLSITPAGDDCAFEINLAPEDEQRDLNWRLSDLDGNLVKSGELHYQELVETGEYLFEAERYSRRRVPVGKLSPNYYLLNVSSEEKSESTLLVVYPSTVYQSPWSINGEKLWGVIIQLYTLRSERNWGIGDFTDLRELIGALAKKGADAIGLNPLHALSTHLEDSFSPYSPSDRRFINPLYIDPFWVTDCDEQAKLEVDETALSKLRKSDRVHYKEVRSLKYPVYQVMFDRFIAVEEHGRTERFDSFQAYVQETGESLLQFAFYEACHQEWPGARYVLRNKEKFSTVTRDLFSRESWSSSGGTRAILFHSYLQWLAQEQLQACQTTAEKSGMRLGLIRDLAVGADGAGAEVSTNALSFCKAASVGAPPDPLAQTGQNWGLPPLIPSELRRTGFRHFIDLLQTNMKSCGALRIDHAMSLMRLWWCPPGKTADHGAYVYYPFHEMMGLLALESYLNKCTVIAEDLGVVPDEFRQALDHMQILTNKVFYFEKVFHDKFKNPEDYEPHALAMVNNHDVPTLVSWWNGTDLVLRNALNLLEEGVSYEDICELRERDKENLMAALFEATLYPETWHGRPLDSPADAALIDSILVYCARTSSKLFVLQLEDLLLMESPVNVPGTFKEHDNWQRKLSASVAEIFSDKRVDELLSRVDETRTR